MVDYLELFRQTLSDKRVLSAETAWSVWGRFLGQDAMLSDELQSFRVPAIPFERLRVIDLENRTIGSDVYLFPYFGISFERLIQMGTSGVQGGFNFIDLDFDVGPLFPLRSSLLPSGYYLVDLYSGWPGKTAGWHDEFFSRSGIIARIPDVMLFEFVILARELLGLTPLRIRGHLGEACPGGDIRMTLAFKDKLRIGFVPLDFSSPDLGCATLVIA